MNKPKHKEPTNYEHCCSCCPILEKTLKRIRTIIDKSSESDIYEFRHQVINTMNKLDDEYNITY